MTIGLEEELMLLDPETLDLTPRAAEVLERVDGDPRFTAELPAAQLEIVLPPALTVAEAAAGLRAARADLAEAATGIGVLAGAGAHPFAAVEGVLTGGERYAALAREYGPIARRQLVFGVHVHVAVRPADRALATYNVLRGYLPLIAALAANAPFHGGADTGLASVRPKISEQLPRQGIPPPLASFEELAAGLRWAGIDHAQWWWEARLHPAFGTVEVRVPDTQTTVRETAAIAAFVHALVAWLADGNAPAVAPTWRIAENRWSACRHGLDGTLADLDTGERRPTRAVLAALLEDLAPTAHVQLETNGAIRQRSVAAERGGLYGLTRWLTDSFLG